MRTLLVTLVLVSLPTWSQDDDARILQVVELADSTWTRNGAPPSEPAHEPTRDGEGAERTVRLPVDGTGVRWATQFATDRAGTFRLHLDWQPGPDGVLFEVLLDGERQPPPRDGWRPSSRRLHTDLGSRWLGAGDHLLEFIAREEREDGAIVLQRLELRDPRR